MIPWECKPDWAAHLSGWSGGVLVGLCLGLWLRSFYVRAFPTEHSQQLPLDGDAGGL